MDDWDYGYDDGSYDWESASWNSQEMVEQERWEKENDVKSILDNDPGYHAWADKLDKDADEDRHINSLAEIDAERSNTGLTIEAWDRV